ncbi:MAG: hypothetical protein AAGF97_19790 [Planctomycetota bacterium]
MSQDSGSLFTHIDVSSNPAGQPAGQVPSADSNMLLQQLVTGQARQNKLLEDLVQQLGAAQRQRVNELGQWRDANPELARRCREASEALSQVQTEFLRSLTEEITDNAEGFMEGEFLLNEFVDRFGPRLAHLNGVLQVLSQLSSVPENGAAAQG